MAKLNRRTDLGRHGEPPDNLIRAMRQAVRDAGDGSPGSSTATWGDITGTLNNQADLKLKTDNLEALAAFEDS